MRTEEIMSGGGGQRGREPSSRVLVSMKPHELRPSYEAAEAGVPGPGSALDLATASLGSDSRRSYSNRPGRK